MNMTGPELNALYGAMISPDARVDIPNAWLPAVHTAMQELVDLPTEVRAFFIVLAIYRDSEGDLAFSVGGAVDFIGTAGLREVRAIIEKAQAAVEDKGVKH